MATALDYFHLLFEHMDWADARMWAVVMSMPSLRESAELRERITHVHRTERGFLNTWRGLPPVDPGAASFPDAAALRQWGREGVAAMREYLSTVKESDLEKTMTPPWVPAIEKRLNRTLAPTTLGETILQAAMHSVHHRAQVSTRIRALGGEPPRIDFIAWLWDGKPPAHWD